jgi:hypothetical protein
MSGLGTRSKRWLRPLIGIVVAYAVAAQALLIAIGGFSFPAQATDGMPAFTLCLHDGADAPSAPAQTPDHPGCSHCILCFAGAHHAVAAPSPAVPFRAPRKVAGAGWIAGDQSLFRLTPHAIANPRGPPSDV